MTLLGQILKWIAVWTARLVVAFGLGISAVLVGLLVGGYVHHLNR